MTRDPKSFEPASQVYRSMGTKAGIMKVDSTPGEKFKDGFDIESSAFGSQG